MKLSPHDVLEPDLVVVSTARAEIILPSHVEGPPDLVIEILSPSTRAFDRGEKFALYERLGVAEYWIVDTDAKAIEQYYRAGDRLTHEGSHESAIVPRTYPGVTINLENVW